MSKIQSRCPYGQNRVSRCPQIQTFMPLPLPTPTCTCLGAIFDACLSNETGKEESYRYCRPQRPPAFGRPRKFHAKRGWPKPKAQTAPLTDILHFWWDHTRHYTCISNPWKISIAYVFLYKCLCFFVVYHQKKMVHFAINQKKCIEMWTEKWGGPPGP